MVDVRMGPQGWTLPKDFAIYAWHSALAKTIPLLNFMRDRGRSPNGAKVMCFAVLPHSTVFSEPPGERRNDPVNTVLCGSTAKHMTFSQFHHPPPSPYHHTKTIPLLNFMRDRGRSSNGAKVMCFAVLAHSTVFTGSFRLSPGGSLNTVL